VVHPHARGERYYLRATRKLSIGSSPRTWGTRAHVQVAIRPQRFIPTHVGNASTAHAYAQTITVHPHARGERATVVTLMIVGGGSSPRTWGTRTAPGATLTATAVHPHARGERTTRCTTSAVKTGSSPRTWGTRRAVWRGAATPRFIPTHVGNAVFRVA